MLLSCSMVFCTNDAPNSPEGGQENVLSATDWTESNCIGVCPIDKENGNTWL